MMIKAIAFDLEGPLVDMESFHHGGHIAAADDAGIKLTLDECLARIPHFIGGPDEKIAEEIAIIADVDPVYVLGRTHFHYGRLLAKSKILLRPGVKEVISRLLKKDIPLSIGSAVDAAQGRFLVKKTGLNEFFTKDRILFAEDVKQTKPAPDVYLETAKRMGVKPEEQLVFEDSPRGVAAAVAAGSLVVGMPIYWNPHTIAELIKAGAKRVFCDWREIRTDRLISNIQKEQKRN